MTALRAVAALAFLGAAPGWGWVRLLGLPPGALRAALVVALSLAADTLVATALFYAGLWSAPLALAVLTMVAGAGLAAPLVLGVETPPKTGGFHPQNEGGGPR